MPNHSEMDWTKSEGHEMYDKQDPNGGKKEEIFSPNSGDLRPGNSGGLAFALGADGRPQIMGLENWSYKKPPETSTAILENLRTLKEKLETIIFPIVGHYHPISPPYPGNYEWNTADVFQDRNYPARGEE